MREPVYVIAEAGSCHDGALGQAESLVHVAKNSGADAVKFQFWSSVDRMVRRRRAEAYREVYTRYRVPESWLQPLKDECDEAGIDFMCSTYLPEDVEVVAPYVQRFKVASFEANDVPHLVAHVPFLEGNRVLYVSCGLGADRRKALEWLRPRGRSLSELQEVTARVVFLHCVSAYPAPTPELNLRRIRPAVFDAQPALAGYSDHADPHQTLTGALAVARGATVVERHLRLDTTSGANPDAAAAMWPDAFREYVSSIRFAEEALGQDGTDTPSEAPMRAFRVRDEEA